MATKSVSSSPSAPRPGFVSMGLLFIPGSTASNDAAPVSGKWESSGGRRRRYYRLTQAGRRMLAEQRSRSNPFALAVNRIVEVRHA